MDFLYYLQMAAEKLVRFKVAECTCYDLAYVNTIGCDQKGM